MMSCLPDAEDDAHGCLPYLIAFLIIGIILTLGNFYNFFRLMSSEKLDATHFQYPRVQIMSLRMAMLVPAFGLLSFISFIIPSGLFVIEAAEALVEGYSIYCFYKMVSFYVGDKTKILTTIQNYSTSRKHYDILDFICCWINMVQHRAPKLFSSILHTCFFQFVTIRPILVLLAGIFEIKTGSRRNSITVIFIALYVISLIVAMFALLRYYHILETIDISEVRPISKALFIKFIILLIVIQNIVVNLGFLPSVTDVAEIDLMLREYSFAVMCELCFLSFFLQIVFKSKMSIGRTLGVEENKLRDNIISESRFAFLIRLFQFHKYTFESEDVPGFNYTAIVEQNSGKLVIISSSQDVEIGPVTSEPGPGEEDNNQLL